MKEQQIQVSLNDFFQRAITLKNSGLLEKYLRFLKRSPFHAPFNIALVFTQNPNCSYFFTARQWEKRFKRTIKPDSRPMIILFPFGPIEYVYDIKDTEGEPITDEMILYWWRENGGTLDAKIFHNTLLNMEQFDITLRTMDAQQYFHEARHLNCRGFAAMYQDNKKRSEIVLHPVYKQADIETYGVLCHEIAHILLGHLGQRTVTKPRKKGEGYTTKLIAKDRSRLLKNAKELEAELVAWIVFNSIGIEKESEAYIAGWMESIEDVKDLNISEIMKVAGKIMEMGKRKLLL